MRPPGAGDPRPVLAHGAGSSSVVTQQGGGKDGGDERWRREGKSGGERGVKEGFHDRRTGRGARSGCGFPFLGSSGIYAI
jgi:hypothetical protein